MGADWVHRVIDIKLSHGSSEELLKHGSKCANKQSCPWLDIVATRANAHISTNEAIHTRNKIKNLSLWLSKTDEAVKYTRNGAGQDCVHGNLLWDNIKLDTDLILSERHVDKDVADKDEHYP